MHKENTWLHPATQRVTGVNKTPGSPRAWINRALDQSGPEISTGIVRSRDLSVSGVWHRPKAIPNLPYNGIFRFFDYEDAPAGSRHKVTHKAIGAVWAVPADDIFKVLKDITATADLVWWAWPVAAPKPVEQPPSVLLPHSELYALFEQGKTIVEISRETGVRKPTVNYVHKKWLAGKPSDTNYGRKNLNHDAVCDLLRTENLSMQAIADQVGCSRHTVFKISKAYNIERG